MKHVVSIIALLLLVFGAASPNARAADGAVVVGVVRDLHGTPQMGALVELLGPGASVVARSFTDDHGRYVLGSVVPGQYALRASAAFLVPVLQRNLRLRPGVHAIANLTMTALFEAGAWLPAERRKAEESGDDWKWSMRSTANRPLLRLVGDEDAPGTPSSSSTDHPGGTSNAKGRLALLSGDGLFGFGGTHQALALERTAATGEVSTLRADIGTAAAVPRAPSVFVAAGFSREMPFGGVTRVLVDVASHPEFATANGTGLQVGRIASAQRIVLGDAVLIDAGSLLIAERLLHTRLTASPYLRLQVKVAEGVSLEYRFATDPTLQASQDLDRVQVPLDVLMNRDGSATHLGGLHQELGITRVDGKDNAHIAIFSERMPLCAVQGIGKLSSDDLAAVPVMADTITGLFRVGVSDCSSKGALVSWTRLLSPALSASFGATLGEALERKGGELALAHLEDGVQRELTPAVYASMRADLARSGTSAKVAYHWQPSHAVTQVDQFSAEPNQAYLCLFLRQKVWTGRRLQRVEAILEASNLLAEGYQPLVSEDGRLLSLAQVPKAVQGGLLFSF